jgi:hypothetical protein
MVAALHAIVESSLEPSHHRSWPRSRPFTRRHLPPPELETTSTTQAPFPSPRCHSGASKKVVLPELMMLCTPRRSWARNIVDTHHHPPWACDIIISVTSLSSQHRQTHAVVLRKPARLNCIFFCHFGPTNPNFDMLHRHIALICYIALNMSHCFDMLHYFWYAALPHCFDMLHYFCSAALLWCATFPHCFDMLQCLERVTLLWYATFLLICYIALICYIGLICYTLLHCFCSATFGSIWMHTTWLNDESELSETSVATWTIIIVLLRF